MMLNIFVHADKLLNPLESAGADTATISGFVKSILGIIMYIGIPLIGLILVYAGFKFLFARGNSGKIKDASFNIMWVLIGVAVFLGAWTLSTIVDSTINNIIK
ncbi:MAG: hypothetical protein LRZ97_00670 [Candidatus Pacebacteria bacterium]|nr:hypothetical protein [Candidatus Paceibacterota bacterium]